MQSTSDRWKEITPSEYPWERDALAFVREALPDHDPCRAWAVFEFLAEAGSIHEVDLLVLTAKGFFLVEIKSRPGTLEGDAGTWIWETDGRRHSEDSPLFLADRKAKRLVGRLQKTKACRDLRLPFLQAVVFCSAPDLVCKLDPASRQHVYLRDRPAGDGIGARSGIVAALITAVRAGAGDPRRPRIDRPVAQALTRAMEEIGIRPSQRYRRVGDYHLGKLLYEGPGYQDWEAAHTSLKGVLRRIRIYSVGAAANRTARETVERAARREFQVLEGFSHPGILRALEYKEHERGPALVFEHHPKAQRLDHFLVEQAHRLGIDLRLSLVRQVAEALQFAHEKRVLHRALSPQSILVLDPEAPIPRLQLFNWQTGAREALSTSGQGSTTNLDELVEDAATVYMAPEARSSPLSAGEHLDLFSLGAVAYHVFSCQAPARSLLELTEKLRDGKGLQIASVLDGAGEDLRFLIQCSTHPDVTARVDSVREFLDLLERVEDELTRPDPETVRDPTEAKAGDRLEGGFTVKKRLGKGSTAVVFLVGRDGREQVLKLALEPEYNQRLQDEKEVLEKLHHQSIAAIHGSVKIGSRLGLLLASAGDRTLARRLREEGRLHVDLLERFGEDLLEAVVCLEDEGIPHRDIKPDNLGIAPHGRGDRLHLVLFDFSLSRAPAERIRAGTAGYLDPFLAERKPPRWDLHAERYSAAVTLHEMATGLLPRFGDGKSDPAMLDCEATLDPDLFESDLREPLLAFFEKALRRQPGRRFDNAQEMLAAWRRAFQAVDRRSTTGSDEGGGDVAANLASATLETPLAGLGFTPRALTALERLDALTVSGLLSLPVGRISYQRGVGNRTRREILDALKLLRQRFPQAETPADEPQAYEDVPAAVRTVDLLVKQLLPARARADSSESRALQRLLGLDGLPADAASSWPSQGEVAAALGVSRPRVAQILGKARERWSRNPSLTQLRDESVQLLRSSGGVLTAAELAEAILALRGSAADPPLRQRIALAAVRAAIETEGSLARPRWWLRRHGERVLIALDEPDGQALADYAERLGKVADRLAGADPLASPARVVEELLQVPPPPGGVAPPAARLVQLAAAVSERAAASTRLEVYPRGLPAARALRLAHGALLGASVLTVEQVRERVRARYPDSEPLPGRPELDALLVESGSELRFEESARGGSGGYVPSWDLPGLKTSTETTLPRHPTGPTLEVDLSPEVADARRIEERLRRAEREGSFLALTVEPRYLLKAERELQRFAVTRVSVDQALIGAMEEEAKRSGAEWSVVLRADAAPRDGRDWHNLMVLVRRATDVLEQRLGGDEKTVLLTELGLLARYDRLDVLARLRERVGRRASATRPLHGLWLLIAADDRHELPVLDGKAIPVVTAGEWARIPVSWLENRHRSAAPEVAEASQPEPREGSAEP